MRTRRTLAGFSLVEVMVATLLLSAIALAVTQTLVNALQVRARSERWMHATQLAAEGIEQLRAGHPLRALPAGSGFERSGTAVAWGGRPGLQRLDVTISWNDGEPRTFRLATLAQQ